MENIEEDKRKQIEKEEQEETDRDNKLNNAKITVKSEKLDVQKEQQTGEGKLKKKEEVRAY